MVTTRPSLDQVWDWLRAVPDPEIPVISVVDLGLIRDVRWEQDELVVAVTPTYSGCPANAAIALAIEDELRGRGVQELRLERRLAPPWTTDWMTDSGRRQLEQFGIAPPGSAACPRCGSIDTVRVSAFGSTPCKALWRCRACLEPFDQFKCI
jgi:ring-1,2-phenylacetyl-CoA epoxidase subunit PaaD